MGIALLPPTASEDSPDQRVESQSLTAAVRQVQGRAIESNLGRDQVYTISLQGALS